MKKLAIGKTQTQLFRRLGRGRCDGLIAAMTLNGSVDTRAFLSYVTEVLAPQLWVGAIVVMDNLKVHHADSVRTAIEEVGAQVVFLAPYSLLLVPD